MDGEYIQFNKDVKIIQENDMLLNTFLFSLYSIYFFILQLYFFIKIVFIFMLILEISVF